MPEQSSFLPVCVECRSAKVKCEKVFPCSRCVSLGIPCLPQTRKRGRPSDGDLPLRDVRQALRAYALHLDDRAREMIAAMVGMQYWKNKWFEQTLGPRPACPPIKDPDFVAQTWIDLEATAVSYPPNETIRAKLVDFESWVPADILALRQCACANSATLFQCHYFGAHHVEPNPLFEEMFARADEVLDQDVEASKAFAIRDLITGVNTEKLRKQPAPDILHRMCSNSDHGEYFQDLVSMLVGKGTPGSTVSVDGVYSLKQKNDEDVICHVTRWTHIGAHGQSGALFMVVEPLPGGTVYLRNPPPRQSMVSCNPQQGSREDNVDRSIRLTGLAASSLSRTESGNSSRSLSQGSGVSLAAALRKVPPDEPQSMKPPKGAPPTSGPGSARDEPKDMEDVEVVIPDSFLESIVNLGELYDWVS